MVNQTLKGAAIAAAFIAMAAGATLTGHSSDTSKATVADNSCKGKDGCKGKDDPKKPKEPKMAQRA